MIQNNIPPLLDHRSIIKLQRKYVIGIPRQIDVQTEVGVFTHARQRNKTSSKHKEHIQVLIADVEQTEAKKEVYSSSPLSNNNHLAANIQVWKKNITPMVQQQLHPPNCYRTST